MKVNNAFLNDRGVEFIKALGRLGSIGISRLAIFTHICDESNFFNRYAGANNYCWFHKTVRWNGNTTVMVNSQGQPIEFVDWETPGGFLIYYLDHIKKNHPDALTCEDCHVCYLNGLNKGETKWSADLTHSRRLRELYIYLDKEEEIRNLFEAYVH